MESYSTKSNSFAVKVGIPELLNGIGNGEEFHVADKVATFRDHEENFVHTEMCLILWKKQVAQKRRVSILLSMERVIIPRRKVTRKMMNMKRVMLMRMLSSLILSFTRERRKLEGVCMDFVRQEITIEDNLKALWALPEFEFLDIYTGSLTLKDYPYTPGGVAKFLKDNEMQKNNMKDVVYGCIVFKLISLKLVVPDTDAGTENTDSDVELVSEAVLNRQAIRWYDSYTAAKGAYLTAARFENVVKLIISSGAISTICKLVTVGCLRSERKVLQYRLKRLSSPALVRVAINAIPYRQILECFQPDALAAYRKFDEAGLVAQIASGPLGAYCTGEVDPFAGDQVPDDVKIVELKRIEAPYDSKTLKQAYIILEEVNYSFGHWYQGKKAMTTMDAGDVRFRALVKAFRHRETEQAEKIKLKNNDFTIAGLKPGKAKSAQVLGIQANWTGYS
ncbi:hypothetical protein ABKV19_021860 [Rosa sericea]